RLRMDLDLAARAEAPPTQAAAAIRVPEWNHKTRSLLPDHCSIRVQPPAEAHNAPFPQRLRADQRRLQRQMAALRNDRRRLYGQSDGDEIDVDACIRQRSAPQAGRADFYRATQRNERDIACLLLADLSLSTEAAVDGELRVIDVIKDSLQLFAETLSISRDRLALYGFNSRQRHDVRMIEIKSFDAACDAQVRGRIEGLAASAYTRMGPVVRHASALLARQPSRQQILLLLSDGKPNDNDYYEGRYGIEDTRHALAAARRSGQHTFCVTIDRDAGEYLPHLFGRHGYTIVNRPSELPQRLALLYARMTRESR
ncbi:MAG: hypothetical protein KGL43_27105, partial [Burkholderiales bacterium]|nr:hypothetical protein [Burkholderiales bacterium]